jgi:hypothetical protein
MAPVGSLERKSTSGAAVAVDHGGNPGLRVAAEGGSANGPSGSADRGGVGAVAASSRRNGSKEAAFTRAATEGSRGSEETLSTDTGTGALVVPVSLTAEAVA